MKKIIDRKVLIALCEELEVDPTDVSRVIIEPNRLVVERTVHITDEVAPS